jgi:hypothetical protein
MRCRQGSRSTGVSASAPSHLNGASAMLRNVLLWFAGVPIFVIILLNVFGFLS